MTAIWLFIWPLSQNHLGVYHTWMLWWASVIVAFHYRWASFGMQEVGPLLMSQDENFHLLGKPFLDDHVVWHV